MQGTSSSEKSSAISFIQYALSYAISYAVKKAFRATHEVIIKVNAFALCPLKKYKTFKHPSRFHLNCHNAGLNNLKRPRYFLLYEGRLAVKVSDMHVSLLLDG